VLYRLEGLGHQWPGSLIDRGRAFGPQAAGPDATALIAAFFDLG
jgi:poly(3-hydroxybutyrate) depolymerase